MDGIKPLVLTFVAWTGAQATTDAVVTAGSTEAIGMIFPILSSALRATSMAWCVDFSLRCVLFMG